MDYRTWPFIVNTHRGYVLKSWWMSRAVLAIDERSKADIPQMTGTLDYK
jgi:hypothetical protein